MHCISLDTNILVYAVDPSADEKNTTAKRILRSAATYNGVLTQQVLGEFLNVSRRMWHLNQRRLRRIGLGLSETLPLLTTSKDTLFDAFDRSVRFRLQFWDAVIVSVCLANGVTHLISEDLQDGLDVEGLRVLNPFLNSNQDQLARLLNCSEDFDQ